MASVTLTCNTNATADNVQSYEFWGANGTSVAFGSCALLADIAAPSDGSTTVTWTDVGLPNSQARTYYIRARNLIGPSAAPEGPINITTAAPSGTYVQRAGDTMSGLLILSGDPAANLGAATKQYVDNAIAGLTWKPACACATTANITLSGEQTIDGVTTSASRVLVKNQSTASQNGIYISASGAWARATDMSTGAEFPGAAVFIEAGTTLGETQWVCTNTTPPTLGTTSIGFAQFSSGGGGTPGGTSGQVQYNNSGVFGGFTVGGDGTLNTSTGVLTVTTLNGASPGAFFNGTNAANLTGTVAGARIASGSLGLSKLVVASANSILLGAGSSGSGSAYVELSLGVGLSISGTTLSVALPLVIGFILTSGATGTNVGPELAAPRAGSFTKCKVITKTSDASTDLTFRIKQNGVDIFSSDPTVAHGTSGSTVSTFTGLTSSPLAVAADDVFTIDVTSGTSSWQVTVQLE